MGTALTDQLDSIFKAKSVAVIGASANPAKWGYRMLYIPLTTGYRGLLYPVNPRETEVCGMTCYKSVRDIPGDVDMAVIAVPAAVAPQAMTDCGEKGIKGAVVITAGFAETGSEGMALEEQLATIARRYGIRFVGPNGQGIYTSAVTLDLCFGRSPRKGKIAFVSQSGTFGDLLVSIAYNKGYGLSKFISIGNQADLKAADYLEYLAEDTDTSAIIFYMEGFKDGRRFFSLAREVVRRKPVLIYKANPTEAAARATMSHTSSIMGSDTVFDVMCRQAGIIRVTETVHMFEMAEALVNLPLPKGNRVGIIGSGGQGVVISATCETLGLKVPALDMQTRLRLKQSLPPHAPIPSNPVDFAGSNRSAEDEARIAEALAQIDYIDTVICNAPTMYFSENGAGDAVRAQIRGAEILASIPRKYGKPVITLRWSAGPPDLPQRITHSAGIPAYDVPEQCARAAWSLWKYARIRKRAQEV